MKKPQLLCALLAVAGFALALASQAAPIIRLSDGSTTMQIGNSPTAVAPLALAGDPQSSYVGALGSHWMLSLTSSPGGLNYTVNAANLGTGGTFLDVAVSDTDFSLASVPAIVHFLANIAGSTQGIVTWWMFMDDGNNLFAQTTEIGHGTNASGDVRLELRWLRHGERYVFDDVARADQSRQQRAADQSGLPVVRRRRSGAGNARAPRRWPPRSYARAAPDGVALPLVIPNGGRFRPPFLLRRPIDWRYLGRGSGTFTPPVGHLYVRCRSSLRPGPELYAESAPSQRVACRLLNRVIEMIRCSRGAA